MYLWNINALKSDFRARTFGDKQTLPYVAVFVALTASAASASGYLPYDPINVWTHIGTATFVAISIVGTFVCYHANGGANGIQFADKYFSIGFVLMIRLLPLFAAMVVAQSIYVISVFPEVEVVPDTFMDVVPLAAWSFAYYWRFTIHLRELAAA